MEYNSDFSASKGVDTDGKAKTEPLLTLDMVEGSQKGKWGLKYVIHSPGNHLYFRSSLQFLFNLLDSLIGCRTILPVLLFSVFL